MRVSLSRVWFAMNGLSRRKMRTLIAYGWCEPPGRRRSAGNVPVFQIAGRWLAWQLCGQYGGARKVPDPFGFSKY